jgi:hypothetical protein
VPGETIDLSKLLGACCTLLISHQQNLSGKTYASIDAVSKPTKKVAVSGNYDPAAARQRFAEWKAKQAGAVPGAKSQAAPAASTGPKTTDQGPQGTKSGAAAQPQATADYDPEVGF